MGPDPWCWEGHGRNPRRARRGSLMGPCLAFQTGCHICKGQFCGQQMCPQAPGERIVSLAQPVGSVPGTRSGLQGKKGRVSGPGGDGISLGQASCLEECSTASWMAPPPARPWAQLERPGIWSCEDGCERVCILYVSIKWCERESVHVCRQGLGVCECVNVSTCCERMWDCVKRCASV